MDLMRVARPAAIWAVAVACGILLSGCVSDGPAAQQLAASSAAGHRPVVVALLDSGTNPYHDAVHSNATTTNAGAIGPALGARVIHLTSSGSFDDRVSADESTWRSINYGELVAFENTRIMAISFLNSTTHRTLDLGNHGSTTSAITASTDGGLLVVVVQASLDPCKPSTSGICEYDDSLVHGMQWIAAQPWIDVVSLSLSNLVGEPNPRQVFPNELAFRTATRNASEEGKIIVAAAGNTLAPTFAQFVAGPPYVISVGGAEPAQHGASNFASQSGDVTAADTVYAPIANTTSAYTWRVGTSFAAPRVAGILGSAIRQLRDEAGQKDVDLRQGIVDGTSRGVRLQFTATQLRHALNMTAKLWSAADWSPLTPNSNETATSLVTQSVPILGPSQTGWGLVDESIIPALIAETLKPSIDAGSKGATADYMAQTHAARQTYWATIDS